MTLEDFQIGEIFYSGAGPWICVDKGTRSITAVNAFKGFVELIETWKRPFPTIDMITKDYHDIISHSVFWEHDFGGCSKNPKFYGFS